jgi:eukaryotic-like serine/threonine-protein kinase
MSRLALSEGSLIGGRYRLEHHLGEGGMGTVWSATHTVTRRAVAMKFLKDTVRERTALRQRFLREASAASALRHPNVVEILDVFDFEDASPVMVMELLQGETLGQKLARDQRLSVEETAALLLPVVSAVGSAHALGIVHRDLKPENLFLEAKEVEPRVKVLDFGIAKLTAEHYLRKGSSALLTDTGSMLGTPYYMAPEQASGERPVDHRADVWSIGVILYECLSGTRPIEGENMAQVVSRLMGAGIIPLERLAPELPHEVTAIVMQMLSRDPARRPDGLHEVGKVLGRYARTPSPEFGAPATGDSVSLLPPPPVPSQRPKARIVANGDADPQGATMLSAPPVNSSVEVARVPVKPPRQRVRAVAWASCGFVATCLIWFGYTHIAGSPSGAKEREPQPAASPIAALQAEPVASAPQATTAASSAPPVSSTHATSKGHPAAAGGAPKARPVATLDVARPVRAPTDEDTLFSGRK